MGGSSDVGIGVAGVGSLSYLDTCREQPLVSRVEDLRQRALESCERAFMRPADLPFSERAPAAVAAYNAGYQEITKALELHAREDPWYRAHRDAEGGLAAAVERTLAVQPAWKRLVPTLPNRAYNAELRAMEPTLGSVDALVSKNPLHPYSNLLTCTLFGGALGAGAPYLASLLPPPSTNQAHAPSFMIAALGVVGAAWAFFVGYHAILKRTANQKHQLISNAKYLDRLHASLTNLR